MILFKRGGWNAAYVGAALAVVITILYISWQVIADDFFHQFPPSVFGFSSRDPVQFQCYFARTKVFSRGLVYKLVKGFSKNDRETLDLHVSFTDMQILLEVQQTAITNYRLIDPSEVRGGYQESGRVLSGEDQAKRGAERPLVRARTDEFEGVRTERSDNHGMQLIIHCTSRLPANIPTNLHLRISHAPQVE